MGVREPVRVGFPMRAVAIYLITTILSLKTIILLCGSLCNIYWHILTHFKLYLGYIFCTSLENKSMPLKRPAKSPNLDTYTDVQN